MNLRATQPLPEEKPRGSAMKFTYPSGSKPLAGYTIKRGIGRGGFGEVYYAVSDAGKEVALKLIQRHLEVELRGVRHCLNLKHPNLLALHDIRTDERDDRWVVMEYVSGESLEDVIERNPNGMPLEDVLAWFTAMAAGVGYLHDRGIVHRDLKPGNIFYDEGIIKIGDYGLAKFVSCSRRSGQTESVGTVHYMAPEIANGRYGKEIDTYALGVMLYEMLTGHVPFEGESVGEVLMKHLTAEPELDRLDEPFRTIVRRALAKDPEARFASVHEMLAMLPAGAGAAPGAATVAGGRQGAAHDHSSAAGGSVDAEEVVHAELVDDEPVWRLVRDSCRQVNEQWTNANLHPVIKLAVLVGCGLALISGISLWFPLLILAVMLYGAYRVVRAVVIASSAPARPAPRPPSPPPIVTVSDEPGDAPGHAERGRHFRRRHSWRRERAAVGPPKSGREKITELLGSMLLAAGIAVTMALVLLVALGEGMDVAQYAWMKQFAWLAVVGTLGAWAVMVPAKIWEGEHEEQMPRRFTMLVAGLLLAAAAFGLREYLQVSLWIDPAYESSLASKFGHGPVESLYQHDGAPKLAAFFAYFGFLMFLLRWWRQADPLRGTRLSLWATGSCVFMAWLLDVFWQFPQPWGCMVAATIAISVQLASPWVPLKRRQAQMV